MPVQYKFKLERVCKARYALAAAAAIAVCTPSSATVVGSQNLDYTFTPTNTLFGYSETFLIPGVPEIQFRALTTAVNGSGQASFINGNVQPVSDVFDGFYQALAYVEFTSWDLINNWGLPSSVGPGGWLPTNGGGANLAVWDHGLVAFSFLRTDGRHYGWLEFSVSDVTFTLHRYGYENAAEQSIQFGDTGHAVPLPNTLALAIPGLLALGLRTRRKSLHSS